MNNVVRSTIFLLVGITVGFFINVYIHPFILGNSESKVTEENSDGEEQPLYWVAPMDPNYKRDKPGKSPMGMDLIPVFPSETANSDSPGTVRISPDVVNNLGVRVSKVMQKALHNEIKTVGYVRYDQDHLIHIHPRVEGWIEKLYVKSEGDPVQKGQPLYDIYSPALVNAQEELLLALERDNKRLIRAAEDRLFALQIPKPTILELKSTRLVKQTVTVFASQSGVIAALNIREGFFVKPGTGMMSIGSLDEVWVEAEVFESQAIMAIEQSPVTMTLDYLPGRKWQGVVDYVYPTLDPKTRTVKVRMRFNNRDYALKPDMFTQVTIHNHLERTALLIPREALIRTGSSNRVVLALGEGRFKSIEVSTGTYDATHVEILSGLTEGESIVTSAQFLLDSESSKTSDFRRLNSDADTIELPSQVWVEATLKSVMPGHRMVTVVHQPIPEWSWPEMTMDFLVLDTVNFEALSPGMTLHIELLRQSENQFVISGIHVPEEQPQSNASQVEQNTATVQGVINLINTHERTLNITREAIEKWNRPSATLDFSAKDEIDFESLQEGMSVRFTFEITSAGEFRVTHIEPVTNTVHADHQQH